MVTSSPRFGVLESQTVADNKTSESSSNEKTRSFDQEALAKADSVFDAGIEFSEPSQTQTAATQSNAAEEASQPSRGVKMSAREHRRRVRLEARRVRRVIRHIEPWSVLKFSVLFYACLGMVFTLAGLLLWSFAQRSGVLESIEQLIETLFNLEESEEFWRGDVLFKAYLTITMVLCFAGVALNVLMCVLYNLISDVIGGIRLTVIEEESARFRPPKRKVSRRR